MHHRALSRGRSAWSSGPYSDSTSAVLRPAKCSVIGTPGWDGAELLLPRAPPLVPERG